ncbi:serine/threonine protein kinase [Stieleria varia]|uniref:Serine/threonine-protein kinase PrkC n=1 Tax=Stieleria varia TaxID=2528005 RepID=A0A5C6AMS8_9BACT|nr:protein kinase [Stieleria varia]TWU00970.1 Serine/threonine-protein kinase PrkC [Stieleria varia]
MKKERHHHPDGSRQEPQSTLSDDHPIDPNRSDTGPVGFQLHDALGLGDADNLDELDSFTESLLKQRGLQINRRIDRGGYGVVYRAKELTSGESRAVKILLNPENSTAMATFQREWKVLSSKSLPGVHDDQPRLAPRLFFGESGKGAKPFLVLEWIDGQNVENWIAARPTLTCEARLDLCERIFSAYATLHSCNLLHRDVSLRNIMIHNNRIRLIDFGSACRRDVGYASRHSVSRVPVTPATASDRMLENESRGTVADEVHAIAKCCFYVLTGKPSHLVDPSLWRQTLSNSKVPRSIIENTLLPRMAQPTPDVSHPMN